MFKLKITNRLTRAPSSLKFSESFLVRFARIFIDNMSDGKKHKMTIVICQLAVKPKISPSVIALSV